MGGADPHYDVRTMLKLDPMLFRERFNKRHFVLRRARFGRPLFQLH